MACLVSGQFGGLNGELTSRDRGDRCAWEFQIAFGDVDVDVCPARPCFVVDGVGVDTVMPVGLATASSLPVMVLAVGDVGVFAIVVEVGSSAASCSAVVCCLLVQYCRPGVSQWCGWSILWRYCRRFRAASSPSSGGCR